jgi:hypothetical protein
MSFIRTHWPHAISLPRRFGRPKPKPLSEVIWTHFAAQPGFREEIRQARLDFAEGRGTPLREIPRER